MSKIGKIVFGRASLKFHWLFKSPNCKNVPLLYSTIEHIRAAALCFAMMQAFKPKVISNVKNLTFKVFSNVVLIK